jgi:hypothetical protein
MIPATVTPSHKSSVLTPACQRVELSLDIESVAPLFCEEIHDVLQ